MSRVTPWHAALLAGGGLCATLGFLACVDTTPVTVSDTQLDAAPPGPADASVDVRVADGSRDARTEAEAETGPSPCVQCLETPDMMGHGCGNEIAACEMNRKCAEAIGCAIAHDCFDRGSSGALIQCGYPCAAEAGITLTDPAIDLAYHVFTCASSNCGNDCQLGSE